MRKRMRITPSSLVGKANQDGMFSATLSPIMSSNQDGFVNSVKVMFQAIARTCAAITALHRDKGSINANEIVNAIAFASSVAVMSNQDDSVEKFVTDWTAAAVIAVFAATSKNNDLQDILRMMIAKAVAANEIDPLMTRVIFDGVIESTENLVDVAVEIIKETGLSSSPENLLANRLVEMMDSIFNGDPDIANIVADEIRVETYSEFAESVKQMGIAFSDMLEANGGVLVKSGKLTVDIRVVGAALNKCGLTGIHITENNDSDQSLSLTNDPEKYATEIVTLFQVMDALNAIIYTLITMREGLS